MSERRDVWVDKFNGKHWDGAWPEQADEFVAWLQEQLSDIPAEYRASAKVDISADDDGYGANWAELTIAYVRPETDAEMAARLASDSARQASREAEERRQLAALRAKYGQ